MTFGKQYRRVAATAVIVATVVVGAQAALGLTGGSATQFEQVKVLAETALTQTNLVPWVDVPGASTQVTLGPNERDLLIVRFTAESRCSGGAGAQYCGVRVLVGGQEANPAANTDFAFDSTDSGAEGSGSWEARAMDRSIFHGNASCNDQAVPVKVQYRVTDPATTLRLDDWHLTVERYHLYGPVPC